MALTLAHETNYNKAVDAVTALGATWDFSVGAYTVPAGTLLRPFARWLIV